MFIMKRNQIIITALVVMIAVAGYLNYTESGLETASGFIYGEEGDISALVPNGSSLDSAVMVNAPMVSVPTGSAAAAELTNTNVSEDIGIALTMDNSIEASAVAEQSQTPQPGEAVFVSANIDSATYFVQAKLDREQSRSKQRELLMEMINNDSLEQVKKADCADAMLDIQKRIEKESAAEAMIEAKGFKEVFVRIDDTTVDVVVSKEALSDAEIAQIEDIIKRKTGFSAENIRISPMNKS